MTVGKFIGGKVAECLLNKTSAHFVKNLNKGIKLDKYMVKSPCRPPVDRITTNTPGRILRMQDAKDAFVLGNRNGVELVEKQVMTQNPNITLTTSDNFLKRFRQLWSEKSPAEILKQKTQRYNDLCYLFGKVNIK